MYRVKVKIAKSNIDGHGVFAEERIPKGQVVWIFKSGHDVSIGNDEFDKLEDREKEQLRRIAYLSPWSNKWVYPPTGDPAEFTNHSSDNNLTAVFDSAVSQEPYFVANKEIMVGEELTNNYHEFDEVTQSTDPGWAK